MKDLYHNVLVTQVLSPVTATAAKTSSAIDLQGFDSLSVVFNIGQSGDTLSGSVYWTLKLQHCDDDSTYIDVTTADLLGSAATVVIDASNEDELAYTFGYIGPRRYVKAIATPTGTHSNGTPIGMVSLKGHASQRPVV